MADAEATTDRSNDYIVDTDTTSTSSGVSSNNSSSSSSSSNSSPEPDRPGSRTTLTIKFPLIIGLVLLVALAASAGVYFTARTEFDYTTEEDKSWDMRTGQSRQQPKEKKGIKPGECPASDGFGVTVHECRHDSECELSKKCCPVGGGSGWICAKPLADGRVTPVPSRVQSTPPGPTLKPCPDFLTVGYHVVQPCQGSFGAALTSRNSTNKCRHYTSFLACAQFVMKIMGYWCSEQDLQRMIERHYGHLSNFDHGPARHSPGDYSSNHHDHYWSSSVSSHGYGSSQWDNYDWSDYYGSSRSYYSSNDYDSYWSSSASSGYYGDNYWDNYDYYGSGRSYYSSNDYDSSWSNSASSGSYGDSYWDNYDGSDHHGSSRSSWSHSPMDYDYTYGGNGDIYPSYTGSMYRGTSGHYYQSSDSYGASWEHQSSFQGGPPANTSLPVLCRNYVSPSLVDMRSTDPCANPDAYLYVLEYQCHLGMHNMSTHHHASSDHSSSFSSDTSASACWPVAMYAHCILEHLNSALICNISTVSDTIKKHSHAVLTSEVNMCFESTKRLEKNECYQAFTHDRPSCLQKFHRISGHGNTCSMYKSVIKCIVEKHPRTCSPKKAVEAVNQWLSAAVFVKNLTSPLGMEINGHLARSLLQCSSSKVKQMPDHSVLMEVGGHWTKVCGSGWDELDAQVICRYLGFNFSYAVTIYSYEMHGEGGQGGNPEGRIMNMKCSGGEKSPLDCPYHKSDHCPDNKAAAAVCYKSAPVYELVSDKPGTHPYGYVKRTADGQSAVIASQWVSDQVANLLCKAVGYPHGGTLFPRPLPGDVPLASACWDINFSCKTNDTSVEQCGARTRWMFYSNQDNRDPYGMPTVSFPVKVFCFASNARLHNGLLNSTGIPRVVDEKNKHDYHEKRYLVICRDGFSNFTASLFCQALGLGFQTGIALGYQPFYSASSGNYIDISCDGTETQLSECRNTTRTWSSPCYSGPAALRCYPSPVADGPKVPDMTVKLDSDNKTVMVYRDDQWGYVCNDHWTGHEAEKVCRALNFDHGMVHQPYTETTYYPFLIHGTDCMGASQWADCSYNELASDKCQGHNPAGVVCYSQGDMPVFSLHNGKGPNPNYGWVHVKREQKEGRLCATFDPRSFYPLLCRQLGFIDGEEYRGDLTSEDHQQQQLPIWTTDFAYCQPASKSVESCRNTEWREGEIEKHVPTWFGGYEVKKEPHCDYTPVKAFCYNQTARVHSGYFNTSGVLEIAVNGTYRYVCAQNGTYTQHAANAICHTLTGSPTSSGIMVRNGVFTFHATTWAHVRFSCNGTETDLKQCMTILPNDYYNCNYDEPTVAVVCYEGPKKPADGITGWKIGPQDSVLVKRLGLWGHICSRTWTHDEAAAICRTLGHESGVAISSEALGTNLALWVSSINCSSTATDVSQCHVVKSNYAVTSGQHDSMSCQGRRAKCFDYSEVPNMFFVDLEDHTTSASLPRGRVAVSYNGTKAYYCSHSINSAESYDTLCHIMGYPRGGQKLDSTTLSRLPKPTTYTDCWESMLTCGMWDRQAHYLTCLTHWGGLHDTYEVKSTEWRHGRDEKTYSDSLSWYGQHIPAMSCFESEDYRLASSSNNDTQGTLLAWSQGKESWERVCRSNFSDAEAKAACRQLGFSDGGQLTPDGQMDGTSYSIGERQFKCSGTAGEILSSCTTTTNNYCYHHNVVSLTCGVP